MAKSSEVMNDRRRVQLFCNDPSLTHQEFAAESDIKNIMAKYKRTGILTHVTSATEMLGDFTDVPDYRESLDVVIRSQAAFNELPAQIRDRFANDPARFIDYVSNPENREEMIKYGLIDVSKIPVGIQPDSTKADAKAEADPIST